MRNPCTVPTGRLIDRAIDATDPPAERSRQISARSTSDNRAIRMSPPFDDTGSNRLTEGVALTH
jgi:hypothetical protein